MRIRAAAIAAVVLLTAVSAVSCSSGKKQSISTSSQVNVVEYPSADDTLRSKYENVDSVSEGPVLKLSDVTVGAGETAEVTLSVSGTNGWSMCGIHVTYPKELKCVMKNEAEREVSFKLGGASRASQAAMSKTWVNNVPKELEGSGLDSLFFTEIFNGDDGDNGDIVTFSFTVPMDAKSGTVYPIGMYFLDTDMFQNEAKDISLEKYAFEHFQSGSITVK